MDGPLIVTAEMGPSDFAFFDALRRRLFPPERNVLSAHFTMFHALPPSVEMECAAILKSLAKGRAPQAMLGAPYSLGRGVAYRIRSEALEAIRSIIADHFHGMLTAQDQQGWRPHVTVQNKVDPAVAKATLAELAAIYAERSVAINGLALHRYRGGPWETLGRYPFRG